MCEKKCVMLRKSNILKRVIGSFNKVLSLSSVSVRVSVVLKRTVGDSD